MSNRFFAFVHHDHPKLMQIVEAPTSHAARMRLSKELPGPVSYRLSFDTVDQARNHADNLGLGVEIRFVAKEWKGSANNKLVWYGFRELSVENASVRWFMQATTLDEAKRGLLKLRVGNYEYVDDFYDIESARDHCTRKGLHPLFYPDGYIAINDTQFNKPNPEQRALINALFPKPFTWAARRVALKNALEETFWILFGVLGVSVMVCCLTLVFWTMYMLLSGGFAR